MCERRQVLGVACPEFRRPGAFAQLVTVPQQIVYRLPEGLAFEHAAMTEPLSVAVHAAALAHVGLNDSAAVIGTGVIGLLVVETLRAAGCGRIVAVGTTALRVLETVRRLRLERDGPDRRVFPDAAEARPEFEGVAERSARGWRVEGLTRLFVMPPDGVSAADGLVTNFHLPGSSLLMLVAAFAGDAVWREAYAHALRERYRFYSYGDAMLIMPATSGGEDRS